MWRCLVVCFLVSLLGYPGSADAIRDPTEDDWVRANSGKPSAAEPPPKPKVNDVVIPWGNGAGPVPERLYTPTATKARPVDPDAIGVVIANGKYRNGIPAVDYARNDGLVARAIMHDIFGVRPGNVIYLEDAGQADLFSVFGNANTHEGKLWSWARPGRSKVYVYYSGHGVPGIRDGRSYLLPVDADPGTAEINGYPLELLYKNLAKLSAQSVTVMLESCFSGLTERGPLIQSASPVFVKSKQPTAAVGLTILTASQGDQIASWDHAAGLGMFTHYLSRALYGEADNGRWGNGDGSISLGEVEAFLDDEMTYAARREYKRVQQSSLVGDRQTILASSIIAGLSGVGAVPRGDAGRRPPRPSGGASMMFRDGISDARAFLADHRAEVARAIRTYYRKGGKVWDVSGDDSQGSEYSADSIDEITGMNVIAVSAGTLDLFVSYVWRSNVDGRAATAKMRLKVESDGVRVTRMWR